jgi:hypothetical protein
MDSSTERFKEAVHNSSKFVQSYLQVEKEVIKLKPKKPDGEPIGRPLWLSEINKQVPPPTNYDVITEFKKYHEIKPLAKKKCTFGNKYDQWRRTCDIQNDIKIFD